MHRVAAVIVGLVALGSASWAQDYAFPTSSVDHVHFYPTAYLDQGGIDWACGAITYGGHQGSDFGVGGFPGMADGRDVTAAADGLVIATNDGEFDMCTTGDCAGGGGFGNYVAIEHPNGQTTWYAHLKTGTVAVSVGDAVTCGDLLGEVGSSGYSTGPHLHFEVRDTATNVAVEPFAGQCGAPTTLWTQQNAYQGVPEDTCSAPMPCIPAGTLSCGDSLVSNNGGPGSTDHVATHDCTDFTYSGPEIAFTLEPDATGDATVSISGLTADLDLFAAVDATCEGGGCLAGSTSSDVSDESITFGVTAGQPVVIVVEGWDAAVSDFSLDVTCSGTVDTGRADTDVDTDSFSDTDVVSDTDATPPGETPIFTGDSGLDRARGSCGCASSAAGPRGTLAGWMAVGLLAGFRRRAAG